MNIGKDKRHPRYICDKCKREISYIPKKGFKGLNKYYKQKPCWDTVKKNFDLCDECEEKFREWLEQKEIETTEEVIARFPIYQGGAK